MRLESIRTLFPLIFLTPALLPSQTAAPEIHPLQQPLLSDRSLPNAAALDHLEKVLDQRRESGNRAGEAIILCALANTYSVLAQQQKAIEHLQLARAIYSEMDDKLNEAKTLSLIGDVYRTWGFP